jgi:glutamate formiminotransferase
MEDCIEIARDFADRLAMELSVPVYIYGDAQEREYRRDLNQIREGEYEALYSKVYKENRQERCVVSTIVTKFIRSFSIALDS